MLPCELPNPFPPLDPAERERRLNGFIDDLILVERHVLSSAEYLHTKALDRLCESVVAGELPDAHTLARITAYVLFHMQWDIKHRRQPLTPHETAVHEAAWRLSDCVFGPRTH